MEPTFLIYGATGYTGELIARAAVQRHLRPILASRNESAVARLADDLKLEYRAFALDIPESADTGLANIDVVLNCAGPFAFTATRLATACIRTRTHYLDLAGEVPEFQELAKLDSAARAANVMLLPGVGFGVVPSDCLALHLKSRLPSATQLSLAFHTLGGVSRGTLLTLIKDLPHGGVTRHDGELIPIRAGAERRRIDFGYGSIDAATNPWRGDIFTAYYSTGIPTIKAYTVYPRILQMVIRTQFMGILSSTVIQRFLKRQVQRQPSGPTAQERAQGQTILWGEAIDISGQKVTTRLTGPEAYDFTVMTALASVERVLSGEIRAGFHTPAQVYGTDFILDMPGVMRIDSDA